VVAVDANFEQAHADSEQAEDRIRLRHLIYGAFIVVGVYMVQPFLAAASLDVSAKVCVIAFSVAIPLLAALIVVERQQGVRRRKAAAALIATAQIVAQWCSFVGVVAGFWHITWVAGVAVLASALLGTVVIAVGTMRPPRSAVRVQMAQGSKEGSKARGGD
jgi:hypothetical protein